MVADCLTLFKPLADDKRITLTADLSPATVNGDPDSLAQLVSNLVNNAIQHNHADGKVHVKLTAADDAVVLAVTDTGPGIPAKDRRASSNASSAWTKPAPAPPAAPA